MKILLVTRDIKDGVGTTVKNLVLQYEQRSDVELITVICPEVFPVKTSKVKFLKAPVIGKYFFTKEPYFSFVASRVLRKELSLQKYDIVHLHSNILSYKFRNRNIISTFQGSHEALLKVDIPVVSTFHGSHKSLIKRISNNSLKYFFGKYLHLLFIFLDNLRLKNSQIITCVSKFTLNELSTNSNLPKDKFAYIPNGVNMEIYKPVNVSKKEFLKTQYNIDVDDKKILLCIGRLELGKGVQVLAKAMKDEKNIILIFAGVGPEKASLEKYNNVVCLGYISDQKEKNELINCADIFILPSLYENFPSVIVEAMAAGKAIISTKVGMVPELLGNREDVLVNINDSEDLTMKIQTLLSSPSQIKKEGEINHEYAKSNLNWKDVANKYISLYNHIINYENKNP